MEAGAEQARGLADSAAAEVRAYGRLGCIGFYPAGGPEVAVPGRPLNPAFIISRLYNLGEYEVESTNLCPLEGPGDPGGFKSSDAGLGSEEDEEGRELK
eukprot:15441634-Alexandrium_andersonii.AAC.1